MSRPAFEVDPSCMDDFDPNSLPVEVARARIDAGVRPVTGREQVALRQALGRVLAHDVRSPVDVPAHTNSAMDGYALRAADLAPGEGGPAGELRALEVTGTALAGRPWHGRLEPGQCVRIMTGAPMPEGADTVVIQERVRREGSRILCEPGVAPGENVRLAGEDLARGAVALREGVRVGPAELGVLASLGVAEVGVRRRPRVAFFSTGDELRSIGEPLEEGCIYDSNRYTLWGMLTRLGVDVLDMGVVRDEAAEVRRAFRDAAASADAVITSGGVSVGEADFVKETLEQEGEIDFWKIAMKPGRPLAFGHLGGALFFGLPGNPVSVMVTFYQFVQPALRKLAGERVGAPVRIRVPCLSRLRKRPGRTEFQRGILELDENGRTVVRTTGGQGSGILSSMHQANCFIILPLESGGVEPGEEVEVEPFHGIV